jgi:hypothetical protein
MFNQVNLAIVIRDLSHRPAAAPEAAQSRDVLQYFDFYRSILITASSPQSLIGCIDAIVDGIDIRDDQRPGHP